MTPQWDLIRSDYVVDCDIDSIVHVAAAAVVFAVQQVPLYWSWVGPASFCTYAYAGLVRNEFEGLMFNIPQAAISSSSANFGSGNSSQLASQAAVVAAAAAGGGGNWTAALGGHPALGSGLLNQVLEAVAVAAGNSTNLHMAVGLGGLGQMGMVSGGNASITAAAAEMLLGNMTYSSDGLGSEVTGGMGVPGLSVVPASVPVDLMGVEQFIGVMAGFTVAGWLAVLVATAVAVKLRLI